MSLDRAERAMLDFCRAAWRVRAILHTPQQMEKLASNTLTALERFRRQGWTEEEWMRFIAEIGLATRPDKPSA